MSDYLDPDNDELLKDFFAEAQAQVESMEHNVLALEDDPDDGDAVDEIFRAAHTLKGGSATVRMEELSGFTHLLEDLLDEIREGSATITGEIVDVLLSSIDVIKGMIEARRGGDVYDEDYSTVRTNLELMISQDGASVPERSALAPTPTARTPGAGSGKLSEYDILEMREAAGKNRVVKRIRVTFDPDNPMNTVGAIQVFAKIKEFGQVLKTSPDFESLYEDVFYPTVDYYVATDSPDEDAVHGVTIPDVTLDVNVIEVGDEGDMAPADNVPAADPAMGSPSSAGRLIATIVPDDEGEDSGAAASVPAASVPSTDTGKPSEKPAPERRRKDVGVREVPSGSVLRVDSKRIDNLLNLVSEAVINKATFNQIGNKFGDILGELSTVRSAYAEGIKGLFEDIPTWLEEIREGRPVKEIKAEILEKYGGLNGALDGFENHLKNGVGSFRSTASNLARNTGDLHEAILRIRMVPISQIFSRFPRLVRDLSRTLEKKVDLVIEGEETELDKSVTEELLDPLMHCVRNSLDHGIEKPGARLDAGKAEEGRLLMKASNEGNMIIIEIADDGAGINVAHIREMAIERGLIHPNKSLSDVEAHKLIMEPGFSTAREVTNISGRGVGLDVVKKQIEKLNGTITIDSTVGEGTWFTIKLPLTLAIIQGLLVKVGGETYAIPITSVIESHRIKPDDINIIDNHEVLNIRDDVVSLVRLGKLFRIESENQREHRFVVVVGSGERKMGLMVDSLIGEEDVVIKPLRDRYTNSPGIAGATILGDGTVSLIIDVSQLLDLGVRRENEARLDRAEA